MFAFLYQIAIVLTLGLARIIAPLSKKIARFFDARAEAKQPSSVRYQWWIHCASYGEYEMALPLIEAMDQSKLLVSFFSPSGYQQIAIKEVEHAICYAPLDTKKQVQAFYRSYQPQSCILVRYELWYNLLAEGLKGGVQFHLVNARVNKSHLITRWFAKPYRKLLGQFQSISTSDEGSVALLSDLGIEAKFTGDTRYDRVKRIQSEAKAFPQLEAFKGDAKLIVLGSTYFYEERVVQEILHELEGVKLLIAPHTIDDDRIQEIETLFSEYKPKRWTDQNIGAEDQLVILDTIGMLSSVYRYADLAFVGGGFTGALHNVIEPLVWGSFVVFGPLIEKYPEAQSMADAGIANSVKTPSDFENCVHALFDEPDALKGIHEKAMDYIQIRLGASQRILEQVYLNN